MQEVSFLTNGSTLTEEYFTQIMLAGADWITISIDGMHSQYEKIRKPLKFNDIFDKVKAVKRIKDNYGKHRPVIKVQTIWPAIQNNPEEFYKTFKPYTDLIAFNPIIDFSEHEENPACIENFSCAQLYQRIAVTSAGKVLCCTNDEEESTVLGDVRSETIYSVWHGEKLNHIRKLHESGEYRQIERCKACYITRRTEDSESAFVEGRKIIIQNYVKNR